jgi:hypothetical protein
MKENCTELNSYEIWKSAHIISDCIVLKTNRQLLGQISGPWCKSPTPIQGVKQRIKQSPPNKSNAKHNNSISALPYEKPPVSRQYYL